MTTERSIVEAIRKYLKSLGAKTYKIHGGPNSHAGAPDIIGSYVGLSIALEVKRPGEDPTPIQRHELEEWRRAGAIAGCVRSVEDVKNLLGGLHGKG